MKYDPQAGMLMNVNIPDWYQVPESVSVVSTEDMKRLSDAIPHPEWEDGGFEVVDGFREHPERIPGTAL